MRGLTGYWHKEGLDLYRFDGGAPVRIGGGSLESLAPVRNLFRKRVLIVGRERLFHLRKRYPPAPREKLIRAVSLELGEITPFARPAFFCRVFQASPAYTELDIWAWESEDYGRLRKIFPFSHAIPEDAAFSSSTAEVLLWTRKGMTSLLAVEGKRFLGVLSHPAAAFTEEDWTRFVTGLDSRGTEIRKVRVYGELPFPLEETGDMGVSREPERDDPPCLASLPALKLREFKARGEGVSVHPGLCFRAAVYAALGVGLFFYLTGREYAQCGREFQENSRRIEREILAGEAGTGAAEDCAPVREELAGKLAGPLPVHVLDLLARTLPNGTHLTSVLLNEKTLEISGLSRDPLGMLTALAEGEAFRNIQLKGPLSLEAKDGAYPFSVTLEVGP